MSSQITIIAPYLSCRVAIEKRASIFFFSSMTNGSQGRPAAYDMCVLPCCWVWSCGWIVHLRGLLRSLGGWVFFERGEKPVCYVCTHRPKSLYTQSDFLVYIYSERLNVFTHHSSRKKGGKTKHPQWEVK